MAKESDKFAAMLGFAKRARKIVYGLDELKKARGVRLLAVSDTASENLAREMRILAERKAVKLVTATRLEELVGGNCKALGITDASMAKAMAEYAGSGVPGYKI